MARHAGFSAVAAINEVTVNQILDSYARSVGPFVFPLPQVIDIAGSTVTFSGVVDMAPPVAELHVDSNDRVTVHFLFQTTFQAQVDGGIPVTWKIQLSGSGAAALLALNKNDMIVVGLDVSTVIFTPLIVRQLSGPSLPAAVLQALQSPTLAAAATALVETLPPLTATAPVLPARIKQTFPAPKVIPVFDWFTIDLTVSRVVIRPLEKAIAVAIDFDGFSNGDATNLVDLTTVPGVGSTYITTITPDTDPDREPVIVRRTQLPGGSIASLLNIQVLGAIVTRQISPQIGPSHLPQGVILNDVDAWHDYFDRPLRGTEDGLKLALGVTDKGVNASVYVIIQPVLVTFDGPTNFIQNDAWYITVGDIDVRFPALIQFLIDQIEAGWLVAGAILSAVGALAIFRFFLNDLTTMVTDLLAKLDTANLADGQQAQLQSRSFGVHLPGPWLKPLPGLDEPNWNGMLRNVSFTGEGVDAALTLWPDKDMSSQPIARFSLASWPAYQRQPFSVRLLLRSDWKRLAASPILLNWEVRRADNNAVVARLTRRYDDPIENGVVIPHHSEALYTVGEFIVRCRVTITVGPQTGEIWSGAQSISILDPLDRTRNYVEWGPRVVYIRAPGPNGDFWHHIRRSRIHRTAVAARCQMLWQRITGLPDGPAENVTYRDSLPFPLSEINTNRKIICEYCFFGGPDKFGPFPEENWFEPDPRFTVPTTMPRARVRTSERGT